MNLSFQAHIWRQTNTSDKIKFHGIYFSIRRCYSLDKINIVVMIKVFREHNFPYCILPLSIFLSKKCLFDV